MRILIIHPWINYRGAENVIINQLLWLNKKGHPSKTATLFIDRSILPQIKKTNDFILPPQFLASIFEHSRFIRYTIGPFFLLFLLLKNARSFDYLSVHTTPAVWLASFTKPLHQKAIVWTVHALPVKISWHRKASLEEYLFARLFYSRLDRYFVARVELFASVSQKISRQFYSRYAIRSSVIYPAFSPAQGRLSDLPQHIRYLRRQNKLVLIHVGNLHRQKRQFLSLKLVRKLNSGGIKAALIIIGSGPARKTLSRKAKDLKIEDKILFAGFVPRNLLGAYYRLADLNLLPSVNESFAATPLEALDLGTISLVSHKSGSMELLSPYLLGADPNLDDLYRKVILFIKNRSRYHDKIIQGKKFIKKNINWPIYTSSYLALLSSFESRRITPATYSKTYFAAHHRSSNIYLKNERQTRLDRALSLADIKPGDKLLDLGCGNGDFSILAAERGAGVWGIDYSRDALSLARQNRKKLPYVLRQKLHFKLGDAASLNFPSHFFNRVVCLDVIEHLYPPQLVKVSQEIVRVTKPGGIIIFETAPNSFLHSPLTFLAKALFRTKGLESESYHINLFNFFKFKSFLSRFPGRFTIYMVNDGKKSFSSRLSGSKADLPSWVVRIAWLFDFTRENPLSAFIISRTFLKIFLTYDLWAKVTLTTVKE